MEKVISGLKIFQKEFELLRLYVNEYGCDAEGNRMTSSTLAAYLLVRDECDAFGEVAAHEFSIAKLAKKAGMAYPTVYKGFHTLIKLGFISTYFRSNGMEFYRLANIRNWNSPETGEDLNYYRIPKDVFTSGILPELVRASDVQGILALLDLSNAIYRHDSIYKSTQPIKRNESKLLLKYKKNSRNKKSFLQRLMNFFNMKSIHRRSETLWELQFHESSYTEVENETTRQLTAALRKEVSASFSRLTTKFKQKDLDDVSKVISHAGISLFEPLLIEMNLQQAKKWVADIHMDAFEDLLDKERRESIYSIGGYYRTVFQDKIKYKFHQLTPAVQSHLLTYWSNSEFGRPAFIN